MLYEILNLLNQFYIPKINILDIFEILFITTVVYYTIKYMKDTRMWIVLKGLMLLGVFYCVAYILSFDAILLIFQSLTLILTIAVVIIFQPEIRKFLENIGSKKYQFVPKKKNKGTIKQKISDNSIEQLANACYALSKEKTGALIVVENTIPLTEIAETGIKINASISSQLLINIFEKNTPLHDGAVVIQKNKIASATSYLPLSENPNINKKLGTRHRAAIGATETTDALTIIVSEETGAVSVARYGKIKHNIKEDRFREELKRFQEETAELQQTNIKDGLFRNMKTKTFSLILSFMIWIVLINISNPIVSKTFWDVPIIIQNESAITSIEKTYSIKSDETTTVVVTGNRADIDKLSKDDIKVYADFAKLSVVYSVPLNATVPDYPDVETYVFNDIMQIALEDMVETEFKIEINKVGVPNENCYVYDIESNIENITIKSGESIIKIIDKVCVNVNVDNIKGDKSFTAEPVVYDRNGNIINPDKLFLSDKQISGSIKTYDVIEVPLKLEIVPQDTLTESLIAKHYCSIDTIHIAGPQEAIESFDGVFITVPVIINETQAENDIFIKNIKISDYFSEENIYLVSDNLSANITIELNDTIKKSIQVNTSQIEIRNKNECFDYAFKEEIIEIIVFGKKNDVLLFDANKLSCFVDAIDKGSGTYELSVSFIIDGNINIEETKTKLSIKAKEEVLP